MFRIIHHQSPLCLTKTNEKINHFKRIRDSKFRDSRFNICNQPMKCFHTEGISIIQSNAVSYNVGKLIALNKSHGTS